MVRRVRRARRYKGGSLPPDEVVDVGAYGTPYADQMGNLVLDNAKSWIQKHRDNKTISNYFQKKKWNKFAKVARWFGFGRKKRTTRRRRGGMVSPLLLNGGPLWGTNTTGGRRRRIVRRRRGGASLGPNGQIFVPSRWRSTPRLMGGRRRTTRRRRGGNIFSSIWDGAKTVFNTAKDIALPIVAPIAKDMLVKAISGGKRRYRKARRVGGRRKTYTRRRGRGLFSGGLASFLKPENMRQRTENVLGIMEKIGKIPSILRAKDAQRQGKGRRTRKVRRVRRGGFFDGGILSGWGKRRRTTRRTTRRRGKGFVSSLIANLLPI